MDGITFYTGKYRKKSSFLKSNKIKYTTFCCILDYFSYIESVTCPIVKGYDEIINYVIEKTEIKKNKENSIFVNAAITEMIIMGLIKKDIEGGLSLSDEGRKAYKNQTFHIVASNIYEAEESRTISRIAVVIALLSLLISIIVIILDSLIK